ncbi:hypothetical protein HDU97_004895, partial [Phlyctochytrium planicorne]
PYKYLQQVAPLILPNYTWWLVDVPTNLINANDYFVRIRIILDGSAYASQDVGLTTPYFSIQDPDPSVKNASTITATFGKDPWTIPPTSTKVSIAATGGGYTYDPTPNAALGKWHQVDKGEWKVVAWSSAIALVLTAAMFVGV